MADNSGWAENLAWNACDLSLDALAAMRTLPGVTCGVLSPLARLAAGRAVPTGDALPAALQQVEALSLWALPALLDPRLTVCLIAGDQDEALLRQFAWPDAPGRGPGFELQVTPDALTVSGPVAMPQVRLALGELLSPPESPAATMALTTVEFWVLAALTDAYRMTLAARRLSRQGGWPRGVRLTEVAEAWRLGLEQPNPGWAVSLFSLLVPDAVPADFAGGLDQTLEAMDDADLLMVLDAEVTGAGEETVVFGEALEMLVAGLAGAVTMAGFTVQRMTPDDAIEQTVMGGWRTPAAVWLADLSGLHAGRVELALATPDLLTEVLSQTLGSEPDPAFTMSTSHTAATLRQLLTTT